LGDNRESRSTFLQIKHGVRCVSLAKECLLWFQLDNSSAKPGTRQKGSGIECLVIKARQGIPSLQTV
jgi:hypothetical protein